jgi:hypothetical protein
MGVLSRSFTSNLTLRTRLLYELSYEDGTGTRVR